MKMDLLKSRKKLVSNDVQDIQPVDLVRESKIPFSIQDLPNEILDHIFSFLDFIQRVRIESVCTLWRVIARSPTTIRFDGNFLPNRVLDDNVMNSVLCRCGLLLKVLIIKNSMAGLTTESLMRISTCCLNLVSVELHLVGIPQIACLKLLAGGCPNLRVVRLDLLPSRLAAPDDTNEESNFEKYYTSYKDACDDALFAIAQNCRSLKCLYISNLANVSAHWVQAINPDMRTLCLYDAEFTSDVIRCLMRTCHSLQEFAVDNCTLLDPGLLLEFLKHYKSTLKVLTINYQDSVEGEWRKVFEAMPNLEVLQISSYDVVDDAFMEFVSEKLENLQSLDIGYSRVTDLGIISLQRLRKLKHLTIGQFSVILGYGLELLVAKGSLEQVTIMPYNSELQEACHTIALMFPKVEFNIMA